MMKIILKDEVDNLGLPGDVVDVADGYGRNFLIPRGKAILATRGAMKEAEALTRSRKAREAETLTEAQSSKNVLEARSLRIAARVDERGSLYGSVSALDIQRVLKERGHDIERKRIDLRGTIKEIGTYQIPVQVHPQVIAEVAVDVVDEEGRIFREGGQVIDNEAEEAAEVTSDAEDLADQALEAAAELEGSEPEAAGDDGDNADEATEAPAEEAVQS